MAISRFLKHIGTSANLLGMALTALAYSFFSWADAILKWGTDTLTVAQLIFWNDVVALLTVCILAPRLGGFKATLNSKHKTRHMLRGLFLTAQFFVIIKAFSLMPLANVYAIMFCAPFVTTLLAYFFLKEKPALIHWIAILTGLGGVLIILRPGIADFETGFLYVFCSLFLLSLGNFVNRTIPQTETKLSFALYPIIVTFIISGLIVAYEGFVIPDLYMSSLLIVSGALSGIAVMFMGMGFSRAKIAFAASMHYIQMLWGVLLGFLVFGDVLDIWVGIGAFIIVSSGLVLFFSSKKAA